MSGQVGRDQGVGVGGSFEVVVPGIQGVESLVDPGIVEALRTGVDVEGIRVADQG